MLWGEGSSSAHLTVLNATTFGEVFDQPLSTFAAGGVQAEYALTERSGLVVLGGLAAAGGGEVKFLTAEGTSCGQ